MQITETQLKSIIAESIRKVIKESFDEPDFANVRPEDVERFHNNYTEVLVPDHCLPYLIYGDETGYEEEDLAAMKAFEKEWAGKIANGMNIGDVCVPLDDAEPHFYSENDVYGKMGDDCYKFLIPLK